MKIAICINTAWNIANFREGLISGLRKYGHEVIAVAPVDEFVPTIELMGARFVHIPMDSQGTNPLRDLGLLMRYFRVFNKERPDAVLTYTVKPNIYASIAAQFLNIPVINNVSGLGATSISKSWISGVITGLYRLAFLRSRTVFFQNNDDLQLFTELGLVRRNRARKLPGSGINLDKFSLAPLPAGKTLRFLLVARMLRDKGVLEFVEAARVLKHAGASVECCLIGPSDVDNPATISKQQIQVWEKEGVIKYLGVTNDIAAHISDATCVVLPSYREGTPRALLEAAAMGRPIVTTNAIGCREVVEDGVTGLLCNIQDSQDLSAKMMRIAAMSRDELASMGQRGRVKVEKEFDEKIVVKRYLDELSMIDA